MSLKAIEMQVALPRTFEAGKAAQQNQEQNQLLQSAVALEMEKELKKKRQSVKQADAKGDATLHQEKSKQKHSSEKSPRSDSQAQLKPGNPHPFKGKSIDYSG
ncbi:hypothetical protein [Rossellomorea aquimaris]|uniref:hypothetical protein n=1 Tax=Rossellomorea aquimaris TaxID=189382 RepID=UPI0007D0B7EF|nr:hypothetical protein [Rossellomorea aquimaris]